MNVREIRENAAAEAEAAREIVDKAEQENRNLTAEEAADVDKHTAKAEELEKLAERKERLESCENRLNEVQPQKVPQETASGKRIERIDFKPYKAGQLRSFKKGSDPAYDAYRSGRWLLATMMDNAESRQWCRERGIEIRVQTEGVNTAGGYLVPEQMETAIIDLREQYGMFRANADVVTMSSDHMIIPRRSGGVTAYFVGETDATTESDASWNQVEVTAKEIAALTRMSASVAEDAIINMADRLAMEMAWAFAKKEDECGLDGNGTSTYGGMTGIRTKFVDGNHTAGYDAGTTPCTAWSHITLADEITEIMSKLPTYAIAGAKWYISPSGKGGLFDSLMLQAGGNTAVNLAAGTEPRFAGYPVVVSAAMPSAPTNGTVYVLFGDLRLSTTFGDRRGITIARSADRYFEYRQIAIQASERFCIVNHDIGDTSVAGPIVAGVGTT